MAAVINPVFVLLTRPFRIILNLSWRHLWESAGRHLNPGAFKQFSFGAIYLSVGQVVLKL